MARPGRGHRGELPELSSDNGLLRMGELAEASGVSAGTIKHYLREGLLPEPVKTSRNMSWYPPEFVERIRLIKQLQEERFMPLKAIKAVLDEDPERAHALVELEDRILERARSDEGARVSRAEAARRYGVPREALDPAGGARDPQPQLARLRGAGPADPRGHLAASAPAATTRRSASPCTTRCATSRRVEPLAREEVELISERLAGEDPDRVVALLEAGVEPLRDLIGALHSKQLVAEMIRQREARSG